MATFNRIDKGKEPKYRIRATIGGKFEVQRYDKSQRDPKWETTEKCDDERQAVAVARKNIEYDKQNATKKIIRVKKHGNRPFIKRKSNE